MNTANKFSNYISACLLEQPLAEAMLEGALLFKTEIEFGIHHPGSLHKFILVFRDMSVYYTVTEEERGAVDHLTVFLHNTLPSISDQVFKELSFAVQKEATS